VNSSALLPALLSVTGEEVGICNRQLVLSEGGSTYAAVLAGDFTAQPSSGTIKTTAMDLDLSEYVVSTETANRCMSSDISGPLICKPAHTAPNVQVAKTCLPAGQLWNKTPIFISGYSVVRAFLAWLRQSCPGGHRAKQNCEKLMVFRSKSDGFRSLDGKEGMSFHNFTIPKDRCVRILVMNLGMVMPESLVREELELLVIPVKAVTHLRSRRRDQDPKSTALAPLTILCQWSEGQRFQKCVHSPKCVAFECRWKCTCFQKAR
jgi:hypothetical protein